jgi:hypothetical protein
MTTVRNLHELRTVCKREIYAELARTKRGVTLSSLHHVIDLEWMKEAYRLTCKEGAPGIDGVTAAGYATNLEAISWTSWIASNRVATKRRGESYCRPWPRQAAANWGR